MTFSNIVTRCSGRSRWVNVPFVVALALLSLIGAPEGLSGISLYLVMLPFFIIQLLYPTRLGWLLTIIAWGAGTATFAYYRYFGGIAEFSGWFLLLWGGVPLIVLFLFAPSAEKRSTA